jgi:hypothetical protein
VVPEDIGQKININLSRSGVILQFRDCDTAGGDQPPDIEAGVSFRIENFLLAWWRGAEERESGVSSIISILS